MKPQTPSSKLCSKRLLHLDGSATVEVNFLEDLVPERFGFRVQGLGRGLRALGLQGFICQA